MATFNKYNVFPVDLGKVVHDFTLTTGDQLGIALTNTAPNADTHLLLANITEIAGTGGYTAGGENATITGWDDDDSAGVAELEIDADIVFTATAGGIAQFQYAVIYNSGTAVKVGPLIGWWDYGAAVDLAEGETFTVETDAGTGVLTIT